MGVSSSTAESLRKFGILAGLQFLVLSLSLALHRSPDVYTVLWPPSGVALAGMAVVSRRELPGMVASLTAVSVVTDFFHQTPVSMALGYGVGHATEYVVDWILLSRFAEKNPDFGSLRQVLGLTLVASVATSISTLSGIISVSASVGSGQVSSEMTRGMWLSGFIGVLTFGPLSLLFTRAVLSRRDVRMRRKSVVETVALAGLAMVVTAIPFGAPPRGQTWGYHQFLLLTIFPLLFFIAFRLGPFGASVSSSCVAILTVVLTSFDLGPLALIKGTMASKSIWLQFYLAIVVFTSLFAAAAIQELRDRDKVLTQLHRAMQQSNEGIVVVGTDGTVVFTNPAWARMHGYTMDELAQANTNLFHTEEQLSSEVAPFLDSLRRTGFARAEIGHVTKDGRVFPTAMVASELRDESGQKIGYVATARDLTDEKQAEARRHEVEEGLRQAQKVESLGQLTGGIAHDFNNLLTPILGYADLAESSVEHDADIREYMSQIKYAALRARDLNKQLLAFGRKQLLKAELLDLSDAVRSFTPLLTRTIRENIEIVCDLSSAPVLAVFDQSQFEQILMNLAVNAQDAMPKGGTLTFTTANRAGAPERPSNADQGAAHEHAVLGVSDTGSGIDGETMKKIFEPFFTTKPRGRGTGLGLSTVYGIVRQHGGEVSVRSTLGVGTTFEIRLPRASLRDRPDSAIEEPSASAPVLANEKAEGRILVVDDDDAVRATAADVLAREGFHVITAKTAREALECVERSDHEVDLLLTDVVMPEMDGVELQKEIRKIFPLAKTMFMSGYAYDALSLHGVDWRTKNILDKPFTARALVKKVREMME